MKQSTERRLEKIEESLTPRQCAAPVAWIYRADGSARPVQGGWISAEAFAEVRRSATRLLIMIPDNGRTPDE